MGSNLPSPPASPMPMLRVRGLTKHYIRGGLWRGRVPVSAANDVDLEIPTGQTLALVGASGSGKSTVARCVARLERPDAGQIWIAGRDIANLSSHDLRPLRPQVQMIFQDAVTSMNPRLTALQVVEEPLLIQEQTSPQRRAAAMQCIREVGIPEDWAARSIMDFSGGQRQRLAIARALTLRPKLLVLDESLTGLDLSTQAQIANLLLDLQASHALTYLLISHDLTLVSRMADAIAVMAGGRIVENKPTPEIMTAPAHAETIRLVSSARTAQSNLSAVTGAPA